jgi:hypothetical protein
MTNEAGTTRREFVKRLGKTLAVGVGLALAPAAAARGDDLLGSTHCCLSTCDLPGGGSCPAGTHKYYCTGSCPACCTCLIGSSNCQDFTGGCIC